MPDITVAADEVAATELVQDAEATLGAISRSGSGNLGPFNTHWSASTFFSGGRVDLIPPNVIRIENCELHYQLNFSLSLNLNNVLPTFCLPQVCITIKIFKKKITICTPKVCISWPTITIPFGHSDIVRFTSDFTLRTRPVGANWEIDAVIVGFPNLQIGPAAAAILAALGLATAAVLAPIPFIGPFLAVGVAAITAAVGIAGVTGLLGPILSVFVAGLTFNLYKQPKVFTVLPATPPVQLNPAVTINLERVSASVVGSNEDELVFAFEIS